MQKSPPSLNVRAIAAQVLLQVIQQGQSLTEALDQKASALAPKDCPLLQAICYGVLRHYFSLNELKNSRLKKPIKKRAAIVEMLLLVGLHQLRDMRIPAHAAVNETLIATQQCQQIWAKGLINGILRDFSRKLTSDAPTIQPQDEKALTEHPEWILKRLQQHYPQKWEEIIYANQIQAPLTLRINSQQISRNDYATLLTKNDIAYSLCTESPSGIRLHAAKPVEALPGFHEGLFSVQDEAGQLAAYYLSLESGDRVLDACCAPGSKLTHLLETTPEITVVGIDKDAARLEAVKENIIRLQLPEAILLATDAAETNHWYQSLPDSKPFHKILIDAPCSALGVIRRHPDIKLLRRDADIPILQNEQSRLLNALWSLLIPGGRLVYSTCSVLPEENSLQIIAFQKQHHDAEIMTTRQILPGNDHMDGFFYAVLKKSVDNTI